MGNSLADRVVGMAADRAQAKECQRAAYLAERSVQLGIWRRAVAVGMQTLCKQAGQS